MAMTPAQDQAFTDHLRAKAAEAKREVGYPASQFLQMLETQGGYATAVQLLTASKISSGFSTLWERKRLDLTVEALVLEGPWRTCFDQVLQERAAKRLRDALYSFKLAPAPQAQSTGGGAPASTVAPTPAPAATSRPAPATAAAAAAADLNVSVRIVWDQTVETVQLPLDTLKAGDAVYTLETWKDGSEPTTYESTCTVCAHYNSGWDIELLYDARQGGNVAIAANYPDLEWGIARLHIDDDLANATATFTPDDGSAPGTAPCTVYRTPLYANLTRTQETVLLRPGQLALRKKMLKLCGRCEISGETEKDALEAAHIIDHSDSGSAIAQNALLLRADLHALFDAGKLLIDAKGAITLKGVPPTSRYHQELATVWNRTLPPSTLARVKAALQERKRATAD